MKPQLVALDVRPDESFRVEEVRTRGGSTLLNFHTGYQITLVVKGQGRRFAGDDVSDYAAGDLVMVGPYLPHMWREDDPEREPHSVVTNFDEGFLGAHFFELPEMHGVSRLFARSRRGLHFSGGTARKGSEVIRSMCARTGYPRLMCLLELLGLLADSSDFRPLASPAYSLNWSAVEEDRLSTIFRHISEHLQEPLERKSLAALVNLSPTTFSRFFVARVGVSLPAFLNQMRVGRACRMLMETNRSITEIASECGYANLAHFNRRFLAIKSATPSEFRARYRVGGRS